MGGKWIAGDRGFPMAEDCRRQEAVVARQVRGAEGRRIAGGRRFVAGGRRLRSPAQIENFKGGVLPKAEGLLKVDVAKVARSLQEPA